MTPRKRYAIVGTGGRSHMFSEAIVGRFADHAQLVAFCDLSQARMDHWNRHFQHKHGHAPVPTYLAADFDRMVAREKPDVVIVTTTDAVHHQYIVRAMELGCDAVSEKPMTTDAAKCRAIFDAIERTGRSLRVTFNYRYQPAFTKLREIVASGVIGKPTLVDFQWRLDTSHGADYFRRWHREKQHSGGLLVHKSTHHFDLVNFWLGDYPDTVFAMGGLSFYGQKNAAARGEHYAYDRYRDAPDRKADPFAIDLSSDWGKLYVDGEKDSGYIRDRNVFAGEDKWPITAEDTMAVTVRYRGGTILSYSLIAYCPWEGERVAITGTRGQVEYFSRGGGHIIRGQSDAELAAEQYVGEKYIRLQEMFKPPVEVEIPKATGGHGGGDARILERIFLPDPPPDPFRRDASHVDGAASILTGICANQSIETGQAMRVEDVFPLSQHVSGEAAMSAAGV